MSPRDRLGVVGGAAAVVIAVLLALSTSWALVVVGSQLFGLDLIAYEAAADRLVETGSPYADELRAGPIANEANNVPIGYFYPPPVAQAFSLIRGVDHAALTAIWTIAQAVLGLILLPVLWRRSGGRQNVASLLWVMAFAIGSYPLQFSLVIGNVSGWSALLVAGILITRECTQGALSGALSLLKPTNAPMFAAAIVDPRSRWAAMAPVAVVGAVSVLAAPAAWSAWVEVLPNIVQLSPARAPQSVSLASILRDTPAASAAVLVSSIAGVALVATAIRLVRREGLSRRVVTTGMASTMLLNTTLWDHYLAVMVPIAIAAWPNVAGRWRLLLLAGCVTHLVAGIGLLGFLRAVITLGGFIAITIASIAGDVGGQARVGIDGRMAPDAHKRHYEARRHEERASEAERTIDRDEPAGPA